MVRQVISQETSKIMCQVLENVVVDGSGRNAFLKGYHIAGKTGTSEKRPRNQGKYIASFSGFAPANDPQIACLIMLDEPEGDSHMGGLIAAPVVKRIMEDCLRYLGVEPDLTEEEKEKEYTVPDVIGKPIAEAREILNNSSLKYKVEGKGETVTDQVPKANIVVAESATVILYTEGTSNDGKVVVPNFIGLGYDETIKKLSELGLNLRTDELEGDLSKYVVVNQNPAAETFVSPGTMISIQFKKN